MQADHIADIPATAGAYTLILSVARNVALTRPQGCQPSLSAGWYVYAGSARGPGGIRARLARHLRRDKRVHWHIDQLTTHYDVAAWAVPLPDTTECDLVTSLVRTGQFEAPHPGFGSSDCRTCGAHLLMWRGSP
ncbi:MAG: DUF123 domain-containing protein [Pseudomonadota bacterium]